MKCRELIFTLHVERRLIQRSIRPREVAEVVSDGDVVKTYFDRTPFPNVLLRGHTQGGRLCVVVPRDEKRGVCYVVTAYRPSRSTASGGAGKRRR